MKVLGLLMLVGLLPVSAESYSQVTKFSMNKSNTSLKEVFEFIETNSDFNISYSSSYLDLEKRISISVKEEKIESVLKAVFEGTDVQYRIVDNNILLFKYQHEQVVQQEITVNGKVVDPIGEPLPGVNVYVKGNPQNGGITSIDGSYSIVIDNADAVLVFSFIGFSDQEVNVAGRSELNITLVEESIGLDEVVAIGYGTMKKSDLTGAISSVSSEELKAVPASSVLDQAQGRLAGVDVISSNGTPGSSPSIRIRGNRSITANNYPLFVVDGIPTTQGINDFNPADIESMEVLKDASAVAIYGSRGANGVILITTKRGKKGKSQISYNTYYGVKKQIENLDKMNGQQFVEYRRVANGLSKNDDSNDQIILGGMYDNYINGVETNYLDETYRNGSQIEHQLAANGGNENLTYYLSGSYYKEEGVLKNTDYERFSLRVNLDAKLSEKIKVGVSLTSARDLRNRMDSSDPTSDAIQYAPLTEAYDADGNINAYPNPDESYIVSPLVNFAPNQYVDETKGFRFFSNLFGEYAITNNLKYRLNFGTDIVNSRRGRFSGDYAGDTPEGSVYNYNSSSYTIENILSYDKKINNHNFNLVGLFSAQSKADESSWLGGRGIPITRSTFYALGTAETITGIDSGYSEWGLLSYMGRVNYKFKDKYLLTASGRADGSSRLADGNKWAFFPAASLAWIISEEGFMDIPTLSFLKLRAGYGSVGNTAINPYQTQGGLARSTYAFGDEPAYGYRHSGIANPDLTWEISRTLNFGVDFGLWNNRLSGNFEIYDTRTSDLLLERLLPRTSGFSRVIENVGSTRNRGWELTLSANIINNSSGFKWDVDMNVFANKEEIVELFNGTTDDIGNGWFIGQPVSSFYGYVFDGIWQTDEAEEAAEFGHKPGQIKIKDVNGRDEDGKLTNKPDGQLNSDDRAILGSTVPDYSAGLTNTITYKGFDFSMLIYTRQGQTLWSNYHRFGGNDFEGRYANLNFNYWTPENPSNEYPMPVQGSSIRYSSAVRYFDASFIKLKNISIGYDFAKDLIKTKAISSCRVYLSATNPVTWSKYDMVDPETGRALSSSTYLLGLNLKF